MPDLHTFKILTLRVIDGDTVEVEIDRSWRDRSKKHCRVYGVDCPEKSGNEKAAGLPVKEVIILLLEKVTNSGLDLYTRSIKKGKYQGRYVGSIFWEKDGVEHDMSDFLLAHGLAKPYKRGKTPDFNDEECSKIATLCEIIIEDDVDSDILDLDGNWGSDS